MDASPPRRKSGGRKQVVGSPKNSSMMQGEPKMGEVMKSAGDGRKATLPATTVEAEEYEGIANLLQQMIATKRKSLAILRNRRLKQTI